MFYHHCCMLIKKIEQNVGPSKQKEGDRAGGKGERILISGAVGSSFLKLFCGYCSLGAHLCGCSDQPYVWS